MHSEFRHSYEEKEDNSECVTAIFPWELRLVHLGWRKRGSGGHYWSLPLPDRKIQPAESHKETFFTT